MRPIQALARKGLSWSSLGLSGSWAQPPFWSNPMSATWSPFNGTKEQIEQSFAGYAQKGYKANGIVWTCVLVRLQVFSQARFRYQQMVNGQPGDLSHDASLGALERPWTNGTTVELLTRMEQDVSLAGNFYATLTKKGTIRRLRPDWVTVITGSPSDDPFDVDAEVVGYLYEPRNTGLAASKPVLLTPDRVVHWSPYPDPEAQWRGMSWVTPVVREIEGDTAAMDHKLKFFKNGATANYAVVYDKDTTSDDFTQAVEVFKEQHQGSDNAYKVFHFGGGADVKMVGADMKQLDFKVTQGAGESRIAAASGVGAVVAQFSEGMAGSALNAGNYGAARRRFGDITMQHLWQSAAAALVPFVSVPAESRLWFDAASIPFLQEDAKDAAAIVRENASTIGNLVKEGFTADSAKAAVVTGDLNLLQHTGLVSVQLQEPGSIAATDAPPSELTEMVQKIYLGVGTVLTADEAREILNRAGAALTGPGPTDA